MFHFLVLIIAAIFFIVSLLFIYTEFPKIYGHLFDNLFSTSLLSDDILKPFKYIVGFLLFVTLIHFLKQILRLGNKKNPQASEQHKHTINSEVTVLTGDEKMEKYVKKLALFQLWFIPVYIAIEIIFSELNLYSADYLEASALVDDPFESGSFGFAMFALIILYLIAYIQLYRLKSSGKFLFTLAVGIGIAGTLMGGATVLSPVTGSLDYITSMVDGALLALIYFTDARKIFDGVPQT